MLQYYLTQQPNYDFVFLLGDVNINIKSDLDCAHDYMGVLDLCV